MPLFQPSALVSVIFIMKEPLKILILEDNEDDAELLKRHLGKAGIMFSYRIVETRKDFITSLHEFKPDLIISDYSLPRINGMEALSLRKDYTPNIPFILVTGSLNEDIAVECMKAGADDYVIKQNLTRLVPAIDAAITKQETIKQKLETEKALIESEKVFRKLFSNMNEGICLYRLEYDKNGAPVNYRVDSVNRQYENMVNIPQSQLVGKLATEITDNPLPFKVKDYRKVANEEDSMLFETVYKPTGKNLLVSVSPWVRDGFAAIFTDITPIRRAENIIKGNS